MIGYLALDQLRGRSYDSPRLVIFTFNSLPTVGRPGTHHPPSIVFNLAKGGRNKRWSVVRTRPTTSAEQSEPYCRIEIMAVQTTPGQSQSPQSLWDKTPELNLDLFTAG